MKLLADECVAGSTVRSLRQAGLDVVWIAEAAPGVTDQEVLSLAYAAKRMVLTEDKDFGELTIRFGHQCLGLVLLALTDLTATERAVRTLAALDALGDKLIGHFVVVEQSRIRRRVLPAVAPDVDR